MVSDVEMREHSSSYLFLRVRGHTRWVTPPLNILRRDLVLLVQYAPVPRWLMMASLLDV